MRAITGWHVFAIFALGFGTIIAVNVTLAVNAVRTFPGLEVKNSYVASQVFEEKRAAQIALQWEATAVLNAGLLELRFERDGEAQKPQILSAVFGRATSVAADQTPAFVFEDGAFVAPVAAGPGNWNLRIAAEAPDGTRFEQRIIVETRQ